MLQLYGGMRILSGSKQNSIHILVRNFIMYIDRILKGFVKFEIFVHLSKAFSAVKKSVSVQKGKYKARSPKGTNITNIFDQPVEAESIAWVSSWPVSLPQGSHLK